MTTENPKPDDEQSDDDKRAQPRAQPRVAGEPVRGTVVAVTDPEAVDHAQQREKDFDQES